MAIEISPKAKIQFPPVIMIGAGVCLILGLILLASYFYFDFTIKKISQEIQEKEQAAAPTEQTIQEKEQEIILIKERINDFVQLLSVHKNQLELFKFLEKICLPNVWFSDFDFSFDSEQKQVGLSGYTDSFASLEQQMFILKQEPILEKINLSEVSKAEQGGINFTLQLTFK